MTIPDLAALDMTPAYAAMLCAGVAAWLVAGHRHGARRARLMLAAGGPAAASALPLPPWLRRWAGRLRDRFGDSSVHAWWCLPGGAALAVLGDSWLPLCAGVAGVPLAGRWLTRRDRGRAARQRERAVFELCAEVTGELRAGRQPDRAMLSAGGLAARDLDDKGAAVLAAARFGGDVPEALRETARSPGAEGLLGVAACWQVAVEGGAGLAEGLDRIAGALRAQRDQREDLQAQLAGPRSTALLLGLLPVFGLLLGGAMGADPMRVLLHSPAGLACLTVGGLLEWAGLIWVARLMRSAEAIGGVGLGSPRRGAPRVMVKGDRR
jgi:tight adherence protein B